MITHALQTIMGEFYRVHFAKTLQSKPKLIAPSLTDSYVSVN